MSGTWNSFERSCKLLGTRIWLWSRDGIAGLKWRLCYLVHYGLVLPYGILGYHYTPRTMKLLGGILVSLHPSVRLSVRLSFIQIMAYCLIAPNHYLNLLRPSAAYMCQWTGSALVQIKACRLFGTKPLFKPMLGYFHLDPQEQTSVKF